MRAVRTLILLLLTSSALHCYGQQQPVKQTDTALLKVDSLKAAVVTATQRTKMKGDTLEYNTEHILMPPNAMVEELLKRLPGLRIAPDGTIFYNGEKIEHLLVDGQDIFGSSPTMITRNFDAARIARVEILDRKSDQADFTGIDDGARIKTLNLVLKESAKDGYFGKLDAGGNTEGYYNSSAAMASFRNKEQFTALGLAANTGALGFSSNAGGTTTSIDFLNPNGNGNPLGASAGSGIPRFTAGALHYANTWDGTADHLVANYQYSNYFTQPFTQTRTIEAQPDSIYGQVQQSSSTNQQVQHWGYAQYDWGPTPLTTFRLIFHGRNSQEQDQFAATANSTFNDSLVNSSERNVRDVVSSQNLGGSVNWRQQIGKNKGRLLSAGIGLEQASTNTNGFIYSVSSFNQSNRTPENTDTIDQRKQLVDKPSTISGELGYLTPLSRNLSLGLQYVFMTTGNSPLQATFSRGEGKYQDLVDSLTTSLKTQQITQRATINLQGKTGKIRYTLGNDWIGYSYRQRDLLADSIFHVNSFNWAPRLSVSYTPNTTGYVALTYSTSTHQPTPAQLQPIKNNTNPLLVTIGNPGLRPALTQDFRLDIRRSKTWMLGLNMDVMLTNNSISMKTTTDSLGRQTTVPVNVNGASNATLNLSVSRKILGWDAGLHAGGIYARSVNYVNTDLSRNDAYTGSFGMSLNKFVADKFALQLNANFGWFDQVSSIDPSAPVRYWTQSHQGSLTFFFIPHFEINTNAVYTWQQQTNSFSENTAVLLWNGYVSRSLIHDRLVLKFAFNNMLNANAGITRSNTANINSESSTNILGRYWMVSAVWHFDKVFKRK